MPSVYLIGSLRNSEIPKLGKLLRETKGLDVFDDWYGAGPEADDKWKEYEQLRGRSYKEALSGWAANQIFQFDKTHIDRCDTAVLVYPAGRSGHLEFGYAMGRGKRGFILVDNPDRWDVMVLFATINGGKAVFSVEELLEEI